MEQVNYKSGEVLESLNNKLDRDFNNMAVNSVNFAKYSNNVTNCITEIPQDIKLELNNGTLTLKAGSKVYVPNGFETDGVTKKFDEIIIESDLSLKQQFDNNDMFMFVYTNPNGIRTLGSVYKGSTYETKPTAVGDYKLHYITSENKLFWDAPNYVTTENSLPIAIVDRSADVGFTSIDQVFNGFGYIGSTVFALPGVKGLIPNGRNVDGTLNNIEFTIPNVFIRTSDSGSYNNKEFTIATSGIGISNHTYNETENILSNSVNTTKDRFLAGKISFSQSEPYAITSFQPNLPFHTIDRNDSSWLSGLGMPSNRYIDLKFGATGTSYTAPANGWFYFKRASDGTNTSLSLENNTKGYMVETTTSLANPSILLPVVKNDVVRMWWINGATDNVLRFFYAEGER